MAWFKRVSLFISVNILVVLTISFLLYLFNLGPMLTQQGIDYRTLAIFAFIWGMGGAFISLAISRIMAKWMMGVQVIPENTSDPASKELLRVVHGLAQKARLPEMPEVGIYSSPEVNAFATGPSKRRALVAVSSGLLQRMDKSEIEGVLGHEVSHIANGDMVTMTLLQGVVNAFVIFLARVLAFFITRGLSRKDDGSVGSPLMFQFVVMGLEIVLMLLGAIVIAGFSRYREYRADAGGALLAGKDRMILALEGLQRTLKIQDPHAAQPAVQTFKISNPKGMMHLFASHPPLEDRIARLKSMTRF